MKIQKGKKYVCVKDLTIGGASFAWSYAAGVVYEALSDNLILGDPDFNFLDYSPIGIRELNEAEKDSFVLYEKGLVPDLVENGVYICTKDYEGFVKGEKAVLHYGNLMSKKGYCAKVDKSQASEHFYLISNIDHDRHCKPYTGLNYICSGLTFPKTLKAGDRIIYKVGDKLPEHNGFPYYGHAEVQEVSDNLKYIKIFDKWRSMSDIKILDTVNNG
ncbi:hypothetical protein PF672P2_00041 [Parabacteroides phage PF672P2]|nr:hypothetical protein PF672P2_00041 [Parabacteroides phage PF672P2]